MSKALDVIKHELKEAVFPTIFFFIIFHVAVLTKTLILGSYNITAVEITSATIGALIVAKAILIIDALPVSKHFAEHSLILRILWKTVIYNVLVLIFRYLEELIPLWNKLGSVAAANSHLLEEVSWSHFWAIQIWLVLSIVAYSTIAGLDEHFGDGSIRRAMFHRQ